jgi:hypothetical protein
MRVFRQATNVLNKNVKIQTITGQLSGFIETENSIDTGIMNYIGINHESLI